MEGGGCLVEMGKQAAWEGIIVEASRFRSHTRVRVLKMVPAERGNDRCPPHANLLSREVATQHRHSKVTAMALDLRPDVLTPNSSSKPTTTPLFEEPLADVKIRWTRKSAIATSKRSSRPCEIRTTFHSSQTEGSTQKWTRNENQGG